METQKSKMKSKILLNEVETIINKTYFHNDGDDSEKEWWTFFKERFPNCENFWRHSIVPFTNRVDPKATNPRVHARDDVSEDIKAMGTFHYSTLKKLIYAYDHLQNFGMSSFEDFYIMASACDCAEEFLLRVYLLTLECRGEQSYILQKLKKDDFLRLAGDWYDKNYSNAYENYLKKGKFLSITFPGIKNILKEYFDNSREWKEYNKYSQKIREYRNAIVHNVQIGRILLHNLIL